MLSKLRKYLAMTGMSFRQLVLKTLEHVLTQHEIFTRANSIAFSAMMAFVPFIALVMTVGAHLLPDLTHPGATGIGNISAHQVDAVLRALFPSEIYRFVLDQILRIQAQPQFGLVSITLVLTVWTSSSLFLEVIDALNRIYGVKESRPWWRLRLVAILMTLAQCAVLFGSFVVITFWPQIAHAFGLSGEGAIIAEIIQWSVTVLMLLLSFAITFHMGPNALQRRRWVTPGSIFGTVVFLVVSYLFRVYVQHFAHYELSYGSLAGLMMLLFWFWVNSLVLLMAAEMNRLAEIASNEDDPSSKDK